MAGRNPARRKVDQDVEAAVAELPDDPFSIPLGFGPTSSSGAIPDSTDGNGVVPVLKAVTFGSSDPQSLSGRRASYNRESTRELHEQLLDRYIQKVGISGPGCVDLAAELRRARSQADRGTWVIKGHFFSRQDVMDLIVDLVSEGGSLKGLAAVEGMPTLKTVLEWRRDFGEFDAQMVFAEKCRALLLYEERMEIADGATAKDSFVAKLQMDVRQDFAGVLDRKFHAKTIQEIHTISESNPDVLAERVRMAMLNQAERMSRDLGIVVVEKKKLGSFLLDHAKELEDLGVTVTKNANFSETVVDMGEIMSLGLDGKQQ